MSKLEHMYSYLSIDNTYLSIDNIRNVYFIVLNYN